mgnify:CR=1 FL=1
MIFIDTNIAIGLIHKQIDIEKFKSLIEHGEILAISSISMYELYYGLYFMEKNKKSRKSQRTIDIERESIDKLKKSLKIIDLNDQAVSYAAEIYHRLSEKGEQIEEFDCFIAGTIISTASSKIITNNKKHFTRISEITVLSIEM